MPNATMAIDYLAKSEPYRPEVIHTLLVGEAPPPGGKSYFYVPARLRSAKSIRENRSLPATIFNHYFARLPTHENEYSDLLGKFKARGLFLVDLFDEPIRVRGSPDGLTRIREAIPLFRKKLKSRNIEVADRQIVFLLARTTYLADLKREFPEARFVRWIDFRLESATA